MDNDNRLEILKTESVVRILRNEGGPATIPAEQINAIKALMKSGISPTPHPYLREGMRVRVVHGPLIGIEGILLKTKPDKHRLVLSVDLLQESVCVEIDDLSVEPIHTL
jgi:transcription antitermination factor NusG